MRISISTVIVVAFLDSQFAYCSAQSLPKRRRRIFKRAHHSPDSVPDIEYIIPRVSSSIAFVINWQTDFFNQKSKRSSQEVKQIRKILLNSKPGSKSFWSLSRKWKERLGIFGKNSQFHRRVDFIKPRNIEPGETQSRVYARLCLLCKILTPKLDIVSFWNF